MTKIEDAMSENDREQTLLELARYTKKALEK